ncbi:MAG TPA: PDDEXK nuclease domain-containing protein [Agitococcus sp.]|nr:PDDEXK nuclease domain-containing protein [Agitococcus sp.]HMV59812.1 PDDEXK nuclease domain-containing protein [Agitococcus sp.]HMX98618.1 PDDEXK nuclease domain-containing protein [Agitococcus sp.]HMY27639.1 PDDEXK nuclease domain-containing protein [Agitococcus sp.]HNC02135.1 PDDEXK nuclease domain-containing protein [Agitococcus sp.]
MNKPSLQHYDRLIDEISGIFIQGQARTIQAINAGLVMTYWQIGQHIVEFEQQGQASAEYGTQLLANISRDLRLKHGKGFSLSNLKRFRQFYLAYRNGATVSHQLSWSHYVELLKISDETERSFYTNQAQSANWSVRELKRQKDTGLFLRLATSKNKSEILELANRHALITKPEDVQRDSYVFEFLNLPERENYSERELETALCEHLEHFLLELGKGFTFVGRQYRITLNNTHYKVDLVFYHRILRCFVLIDLKINDVKHHDIGQMNMYMGYFAAEENIEGDNPPIGIILSRDKDELLVEYATYGMDTSLFVQKYQLYLPNEQELRREIEATLAEQEKNNE